MINYLVVLYNCLVVFLIIFNNYIIVTMTGEELKKKLFSCGYRVGDLAEKLKMSQQNVSRALAVADIKTGFLENLCDVLGKDMSFFYGGAAESKSAQEEKDTAVPYFIYRDLQDRCENLIRENQTLRDKLSNENSNFK